jgi:hypothetical protein
MCRKSCIKGLPKGAGFMHKLRENPQGMVDKDLLHLPGLLKGNKEEES